MTKNVNIRAPKARAKHFQGFDLKIPLDTDLKSRTRFEKVRDSFLKCGINPASFSENCRIFSQTAGIPQSRRVDAALGRYTGG